jgi:hypothetical protein
MRSGRNLRSGWGAQAGPVKGTSGVGCRSGQFLPHGEIADDVVFASGWSASE